MVLATLTANHQMRVVVGRRYQTEDFSGFRFDGNDTTNLVLQQALAQHLQINVQTQRQVLAGNGRTVVLAIHIMPLNAAVRITKQDFDSFLSTQVLLV